VLGIARPALDLARVAAPVKGSEKGAVTCQAGGHIDLVRVHGKMDKGPFLEFEQWRARIAVMLILMDGMAPILAGARIFQLASGHRQTVQGHHQIHGAMIRRVTWHLAGHGQLITAIACQHFGVETVGRLKISRLEGFAVKLEPMPQDMQHALDGKLLDQDLDQHGFQLIGVQPAHLGPRRGLGLGDKSRHLGRKERQGLIPFRYRPLPPTLGCQHLHHIGLKGFFGGLALGHAGTPCFNFAIS